MSLAREPADYRHLGGLVRAYDFYHAHGMKVLSLLIMRYLLAILVGLRPFQQLKWLDCYLPGGAIVTPRLPEDSKYLVGSSWIYFAGTKLLIQLLGREFNMFCIEHFCFQQKQINSLVSTGQLTELPKPKDAGPPTIGDHPAMGEHFVSQLDGRQRVQRPIQSTKMRLIYVYSHLASLIAAGSSLFAFICAYVIMMGPMLATRRGFELSRKQCVQFIMEQLETESANESSQADGRYDFIYRPDPNTSFEQIYTQTKIPLVLPYADLVPMNSYHIVRILTSALEQLLLILCFGFCFWFYSYYTAGFSFELHVYGRDLLRRMELMSEEMRVTNEHLSCEQAGLPRVRVHKPLQMSEIARIQASLIDYFNFIAYYNHYISLSLLINTLLWLLYTVLFFARTLRVDRLRALRVDGGGPQAEYFVVFVGNLLLLVPNFICSSILNSMASQIYRAVTTALAFDQSSTLNNKRWLSLLQFFEPRKLYCFTLFNYVELSWLFCFKIFWWVISALVLLVNF